MRHVALLLVIAALVYGFGLGEASLWDIDEAIYADISRNMAHSGDWVFPVFNGEPRFDKPPLMFWIAAAAMSLGAPGEWSIRLGTYIFALAALYLVYLFGRRLYSPRAGIIAAAVLASTLGWFVAGRIGLMDAGLSFFVGMAVYQLLFIGDGDQGAHAAPFAPYIWLGVALALGVLTKGPVAIVLFGGVALAYPGPVKSMRAFFSREALLRSAAALLTFLFISVPWHAAIYARAGRDWIDSYFGYHMFSRFTRPLEEHGFPWYFYLIVLAVGLLPWTGHVVAALRDFVRGRNRKGVGDALRLPVTWFLVVLVFFSISKTKLPGYILPAFLPVAILAGVWTDRRLLQPDAERAFTKSLWLSLAAAAVAGVGLLALRSFVPEGYENAYRLLFVFPGAIVVGLLLTKALHRLVREPSTLVYGFAATAFAGMLLFTPLLAPLLEEHKPIRPLVAAARRTMGEHGPVISAFGDASTNFYLGRPTLYTHGAENVRLLLQEHPDALAIVPVPMLPLLPGVITVETYGPAALIRSEGRDIGR